MSSAVKGIVSAPHVAAAEAGKAVLAEGGNAIEAMVAAAATIAVVYPHMNGIGGDGFWLIDDGEGEPEGIEACGGAAGLASPSYYRDAGYEAVPMRGPHAALTIAGTIGGWSLALEKSRIWGGAMPLRRLLEDAIRFAREGCLATGSFCETAAEKQNELQHVAGFADAFLAQGLPEEGALFRQPQLAATLQRLSEAGLEDFYRGDVARSLACDLEQAGSPLRLSDLESFHARPVKPLKVSLSLADVYNLPPPTQGLASLIILALFDRLRPAEAESSGYVHRLVEATKRAFRIRDAIVTDPAYAPQTPDNFLLPEFLDAEAEAINLNRAAPWPAPPADGGTIWMGAIDAEGRAVSFIQSVFFEFGSGVVLPETGVLWQNRGASFSLDPRHLNCLAPGRKPFHTLNPAMARFHDGRRMAYGTMGGEGQPQTQAAIFTRYAYSGQPIAEAIERPRWLLGRTWGMPSTTLKLEDRFPPALVQQLREAGHDIEMLEDFTSTMGHAGAVIRHPDGRLEGASDPRSDGGVCAVHR